MPPAGRAAAAVGGGLIDGTAHKGREENRVFAVERRPVFATEGGLATALGATAVSRAVTTSVVARQHGTDRGRNAREVYQFSFSKDRRVHGAMSYFTLYRYNFGSAVPTAR